MYPFHGKILFEVNTTIETLQSAVYEEEKATGGTIGTAPSLAAGKMI